MGLGKSAPSIVLTVPLVFFASRVLLRGVCSVSVHTHERGPFRQGRMAALGRVRYEYQVLCEDGWMKEG